MNPVAVSDEELNALMVAIKNRYGLDFTNYEKSSLKRGVSRLMMKHHMNSLLELWARILRDSAFFAEAIDDLLVNLTELFRNPDVWLLTRDRVLDEFKGQPLNIWHAGCSTGEEVITMSIVLEERRMLDTTNLVATDLSKKALNRAKKGEYSLPIIKQYLKPLMEYLPRAKMETYFDFGQDHASIKPKYRRRVSYAQHNLVQDGSIGKFDIIFCRNVMIYFDEKLKMEVLNLLYQSLKPDGFLIIGFYDIMPEYGKKLFQIYDIKTRVYKKRITKIS